MTLDLLIRGGEVLLPGGRARADLGIAGGAVAGVYAPGTAPDAAEVIDASGLIALPGVVDIHFHVRAPAYPERGTVLSETRAAAAGGVTTIFEMPISKPCCSTATELKRRRDHFAEHAVVDFGLYAAPGDLTEAGRDAMMALGPIAWKIFTTEAPPGRGDEFDGLAFPDEADQLRALKLLAETGRPVVVHAESAELLAHFAREAAALDPGDAATHGASRPAICEAVAVAKLLTMNIEAQARLHIAHVTSAGTVAVLRAFAGTSDFTAETCPQYLFATEADVARAGIYAKVNPPIRHQADQDALWQAIADGVINHVTTDHAPFSRAEKAAAEGDFPRAPPGVPGIEFLVPAMLDAVASGRVTLERAHDLICANGARRYGLYPWKGALLPGSAGDVTLVDLSGETTFAPDTMVSHAREVAQLFHGRRLRGRVARTILAGRTVFDGAEVVGQRGAGRHVTPRRAARTMRMRKDGRVARADEIMRPTDTVGWRAGFRTIARVTRLSWQTPWLVTIALVSTVIASALQLLVPLLLGRAVDRTQDYLMAEAPEGSAFDALWGTALLVLLVLVARGAFTVFQNYFSESVGHAVGFSLRLAFYDKVQRLSFGFHDRTHSGDLITLGMLDIEGMRIFFATGLVRIVLLGVLIGLGGYLMLSTDLALGLLALSFVPFVAWRSSVTQLRLRSTWLDLQVRLGALSRVMEENLGGIRVVRAFGARAHEMEKYRHASESALGLARERVDIRVRNTSAMTFSFLVAMGLVLWVGSGKVTAGEISVGTLASFLTFMTILQMPVRQLGLLVNSFARTATCGERVFALIDLDLAIDDAPGAPDLRVTDGVLRLENVGFTYPTGGAPSLQGISFTARKGETIGLIGPPGSGKSTIAHLIPRFYDVTEGAITLDGQDIRTVSLGSLRRAVAVVQQDAFLFTTSLENNIAYGDPWALPDRIHGASASAQLDQFIATLPAGYETVVGERGASLSGGQRQRMTIARTLMLRPSVLIFDDSTAAIDAGTERRIRATIQAEAKDRVTVIVAHRLNSLMHADRILFIDKGRIVEEGTHAELLALGGRYRALHDLQMRQEAEGAA